MTLTAPATLDVPAPPEVTPAPPAVTIGDPVLYLGRRAAWPAIVTLIRPGGICSLIVTDDGGTYSQPDCAY